MRPNVVDGHVRPIPTAGDWPGRPGSVFPYRTGVGPMRVDELCSSCDGPISTTGECKCS